MRFEFNDITRLVRDHAAQYFKLKSEEWRGARYMKSVEILDEIRTHSDYDHFPWRLFRQKAPNETPEEFKYRKSIYRPATFASWYKAVGQIQRIWNPQNWTIGFDDLPEFLTAQDQDLGSYMLRQYPEFGSVTNYFQRIVTPELFRDGNAVMTYLPKNWEPEENELVQFTAEIYNCPDVWLLDPGKYTLIAEHCEKSEILFLFIDTFAFYRLKAKMHEGEITIKLLAYWEHDLDYLPARRLGGTPERTHDREVYFLSYFYPAVPSLDRATADASTLDMSKYSHAFLQRWQYTEECEADGCNGGQVTYRTDEGTPYTRNCNTCGGTGRRSLISPLSVIEVNTPTRVDDSAKDIGLPPAGYIDINHDILTFLDEQVRQNIASAWSILNIEVSNSEVQGGEETALGRQIDREELFSFLTQISETLFGLLEFSVRTIGDLQYGENSGEVSLRPPTTFAIRSEGEIIEDLDRVPSFASRTLLHDLNDQSFGVNDIRNAVHSLMIDSDTLAAYDDADIRAGVGAGLIPRWRAILHYHIEELVDRAQDERQDFLLMDRSEQRAILEEMARAMESAEFPPRDTANRILDIINGETGRAGS